MRRGRPELEPPRSAHQSPPDGDGDGDGAFCACDMNPETTDGPDYDCPIHGVGLAAMALATHGEAPQLDQAIEEMAELTVAIQHMRRGRITPDKLAGEVADVELMLEQLALVVRRYTGTDATMDEARSRQRAKALAHVEKARLRRG